jgi:hypothetical protein
VQGSHFELKKKSNRRKKKSQKKSNRRGALGAGYILSHIHTYIFTYLHTYIHVCMHACRHTHIRTWQQLSHELVLAAARDAQRFLVGLSQHLDEAFVDAREALGLLRQLLGDVSTREHSLAHGAPQSQPVTNHRAP